MRLELRRERFFKLAAWSLLLVLNCSRESQDVKALKRYLTSDEHERYLKKIALSINFIKVGYDNVVAEVHLDTLHGATDNYLRFLNGFQPQHETSRRFQNALAQPVINFRTDLTKLGERISVYRALSSQVDSLTAVHQTQNLESLGQQQQMIYSSITNKFLLQRIILLIDQITTEVKKINS